MASLAEHPSGDLSLRLERVYAATPERIFAALTDPDILVKWWGPEGYVSDWAEVDLRPGGAWRVQMRSLEDGYEGVMEGTVLEIAPPHRLVFRTVKHCNGAPHIFDAATMPPTEVTIELQDLGNGETRLVLTQTGFTEPLAAELHEHGWSGALGKLARSVGTDRPATITQKGDAT